jgi:hypothetical protein
MVTTSGSTCDEPEFYARCGGEYESAATTGKRCVSGVVHKLLSSI